jgi:hypothetical protein
MCHAAGPKPCAGRGVLDPLAPGRGEGGKQQGYGESGRQAGGAAIGVVRQGQWEQAGPVAGLEGEAGAAVAAPAGE